MRLTNKAVIRPRGLQVWKIEVDEEELQAIIDFQRTAASDAEDSCEDIEAKERRERANYLMSLV